MCSILFGRLSSSCIEPHTAYERYCHNKAQALAIPLAPNPDQKHMLLRVELPDSLIPYSGYGVPVELGDLI